MADYKKMYLHLCNAVTDALESMEKAADILKRAQQNCEDIYIDTSSYIEDTGEKIVRIVTPQISEKGNN